MKIMVLGGDGYIGFPLTMHLARRGHELVIVDNLLRRFEVCRMGGDSAIPLPPFHKRMKELNKFWPVEYYMNDVCEAKGLYEIIKKHQPDAIVQLAEIPSAPYSMASLHNCVKTQMNNVVGTLNILFAMRDLVPDCHLLKLGTMGEYGTPNIDIPEGYFQIEFRGRQETLPFPKQAGSWYHLSKVHDTHNVEFACKVWGLKATDIMQGVVYGVTTNEIKLTGLNTRFDFDGCFGTAINRFCAQVLIGDAVTPYGKGLQTRGFIALRDSIQCLTLALENPPEKGEYRVFNQFDETYTINSLARLVVKAALEIGLPYKWNIDHIANPRVEAEEHYYNPDHEKLRFLGFKPTQPIGKEIKETLTILTAYKSRIESYREHIAPKIFWRG